MGGSETAPANLPRSEPFVEGLSRLFTVAPLYEADHPRCVDSIELIRTGFGSVGSDRIVIELHKRTIAVGPWSLDPGDSRIDRVHELLRAIGICRIEIDADATGEDLHRFAKAVLRRSLQAKSAHGPVRCDFDSELSPTVRVFVARFGRRVAADRERGHERSQDSAGELVYAAIERVAESVRDKLDHDRLPAVSAQVGRVFTGVAERVAQNRPGEEIEHSEINRRLEEVLDLCVHAITRALEELIALDSRITDLPAIFEAAQNAVSLSHDEDDVDVMLDVLRLASEGRESAYVAGAVPSGCTSTVSELRAEIAEIAREARPIELGATMERGEQLAILLRLLWTDVSQKRARGVVDGLRTALNGVLGALERDIVTSAAVELFDSGDANAVDRCFPDVAEPLRHADAAFLTELLVEISRRTSPGRSRELLWPHVVNVLVAGGDADQVRSPDDDANRRPLYELAASADEALMRRNVARLERLSALSRGSVARDLFDPPRPELFTLYAVLLDSVAADTVFELLAVGFRCAGPRWVGAEALDAAQRDTWATRQLVNEVLRAGPDPNSSRALHELAGSVLVGALSTLPTSRRGEPWVQNALRALGELPVGLPAAKLLRNVARRRWFRPSRSWPAACREAARQGLAMLRTAGVRS